MLVAALLFTAGAPAAANVLIPQSIEELVKRSDLVVMARAERCEPSRGTNNESDLGACHFATLAPFKGEAPASITLERFDGSAESGVVGCCDHGQSYLLFLRYWEGRYYSVNGRYGVKRVEVSPLKGDDHG